jgi:hypothetical protein
MVRDAYMHWRSTDKGLYGYLSFGHAEEEKKKEEEKKAKQKQEEEEKKEGKKEEKKEGKAEAEKKTRQRTLRPFVVARPAFA